MPFGTGDPANGQGEDQAPAGGGRENQAKCQASTGASSVHEPATAVTRVAGAGPEIMVAGRATCAAMQSGQCSSSEGALEWSEPGCAWCTSLGEARR
jgi:hypothetical protein